MKKQKISNFNKVKAYITSHWYSRFFVRLATLWGLSFIILVSFFINDVFYYFNYLEIFPYELKFPILMHALTAFFIALVLSLIPRPRTLSAKLASTAVVSLFMINYDGRLSSIAGLYKAVSPLLPKESNELPFISLLFLATILVGAILIGMLVERFQKRSKTAQAQNIIYAILIMFGVVFLSQITRLLPVMKQVNSEFNVKVNQISIAGKTDSSTKTGNPNIYYFVLDRYASNNVLKSQFNYDNSDFIDYLNQNNFYINNDAYSNYPLTTMSIASTLNVSYLEDYTKAYANNEVQSRTLFHALIQRSSVITALKEAGYKYYHIGSTYGATYDAPQADGNFMANTTRNVKIFNNKIINLNGIENNQFMKSPYYRLAHVYKTWWPLQTWESQGYEYIRDQLQALDWITSQPANSDNFMLFHALIPHDPYYFNADGSLSNNPDSNDFGVPVKQKYIDQVKFINTQMIKQIDKIIKNDKQAIIILSSDEGPYPHILNSTALNPIVNDSIFEKSDMKTWPDDWLKMKYSILQAVHIPMASQQDLTKLSSVNLFRIILNDYLGYDLDYLPNCNYAFNRGNLYEYDYSNITSRLSVVDDSKCNL